CCQPYLSYRTMHPHISTLFPYTTLFRSDPGRLSAHAKPGRRTRQRPGFGGVTGAEEGAGLVNQTRLIPRMAPRACSSSCSAPKRSEEHTSELQSRFDLVCRLLLEKKKNI